MILVLFFLVALATADAALRGSIVDHATGRPLAARLYIQSSDGRWFFARPAGPEGSAAEYRKQRAPDCAEMHTSLSAHPFAADLPAGKYTLTVERGKEYLPHRQEIQTGAQPTHLTIRLKRWIDMAKQGWYSGETHLHRPLDELPTAMLAEDLNVAFPLTYWVTKTDTAPSAGDKNQPPAKPAVRHVDRRHVFYPVNTEYEIFTVQAKRHTLGAVFAINHRSPLELGIPPTAPIAEQVHREGGLLEMDKHAWPWSMMIVPVMKIDLYELANNHMWRTKFDFPAWGEAPPAYMHIARDARGPTEAGWIDYTFQNYYALLDCGFRLRPTAGTASGVHPVPLGFSRVYVYLGRTFSYDAWVKGLNEGRSFVTTGPMLAVKLNGRWPGAAFSQAGGYALAGSARSAHPLSKIEVVSSGQVIESIKPENRRDAAGAYVSPVRAKIAVRESAWIAVRCFESSAEGRVRFAHTAPFHVDVPGKPLRPRKAEVEFLIRRVAAEIERNRDVLSEAALAEYRTALATYTKIGQSAR